ncbi:hypothetical protein [Halodesulfurarchaeum formicicum]|uniref:hypothetical protein n=1 Tax=Halodesulfurarchaeum formicicum TaxID=1873524 RepID=UPI0011DF945B|nr:hypothetical protein [Halodesulfurarchaeum formicicum]
MEQNYFTPIEPRGGMSGPKIDQTYSGKVVGISGTGNPMVQKSEWHEPVIVIAPDSDYSDGDRINFVVKQEMENHYQALLPERESELSSPTFHRIYRGEVSDITNSGNPIVRHSNWDKSVVVITDDSNSFSKGDQVKFVVKKEVGQRYQALLSHKAPAVKPNYGSKAVIPIHHDGKDNQSIGDTRSETHATKPVDEWD